jgi:hypothetical protein
MHQIAAIVGSLYPALLIARDKRGLASDTLEECPALAMRED